ncbi:MAG: hypothetical protein V4729_08975 [Pseudomonadota bacterium]
MSTRKTADVGRLALQGAAIALMVWAGDSQAHGGGGTPMPTERRPEPTEPRTPRYPSPPASSQWPTGGESEAGRPGMVEAVVRRLNIGIDNNMHFTPDTLQVTQGETVRLRLSNNSSALLAFVLGTPADIAAQGERLQQVSGGEPDVANTAQVYAGQSGEIIWQFTRPGTFQLAALVAGHPHASPRAIVTVIPPATAGDTVQFILEKQQEGALVPTDLEKAP